MKCPLCNNEFLDEIHKSSDLHRFNYLLNQWKDYRKSLVKDRNGMIVSEHIKTKFKESKNGTINKNKGKFTLTLSTEEFQAVNNKVVFNVRLFNDRNKDSVYIMKSNVLIPYKAFNMQDPEHTCYTDNIIELESKNKYEYVVEFKLDRPLPGSYKIPLTFTFQTTDEEPKNFAIARQIVVIISDEIQSEKQEETGKSPFKCIVWEDIIVTIPCVSTPRYPKEYSIPDKYRKILMTGLKDSDYLNFNDKRLLNFVRNCICPGYLQTGNLEPNFPTEDNYKDFFHFLLWLDEIGQRLMLQRYNMSNVNMTVIAGDMLELEVPGLAEKRPSLIAGDIVNIRLAGDHTVYKGTVKTLNDKTIWIYNMHADILNMIKDNSTLELDVAFELGRLVYERMHKAIDDCIKADLLKLLFPSIELKYRLIGYKYNIPNDRFFNQSILNNQEQKTAVLNILNCTSQYAPYIVFGPPGTGKTLTIVEAILQINRYLPNSKILVCAPANAACDMLTSKLTAFIKNKQEIIRVHTESRNWNEVPENIRPYSNHDGKNYIKMNAQMISSYRIVITTLILIGKYSGSGKYKPDFVFIDEAAQAMEPEADVAISMLQLGKQLVLAGDPKQLGPQCASAVAAKFKLECSLLERLMDTNPLYNQDGNQQTYNNRFITMLKLNYRAHPVVLQVPNDLFYENKLKAVNKEAANDPIAKIFIHPLTMGALRRAPTNEGLPVEFCAVLAKEQRHGKSPSYFNESELQMVVKYVKAMLSLRNVKVEESDIGIVTPYIRQVHRIKDRLQKIGHKNIEVGTTEVFQGREKRIIIISTVRGQHDLLLIDRQYKLGFVSNEKRMNVALTRAMSKLIIIGNPHVLGTCKNWEYYIEFCEQRNAYFGAQYLRRTNDVKQDICRRFANVPLQNFVGNPVKNKKPKPKRKGK